MFVTLRTKRDARVKQGMLEDTVGELEQSQPGHRQQEVNLTLITHTHIQTHRSSTSTVYTHSYTVSMYRNTHTG